eukprot:scaffold59946_cov59-Cyclotella_meneghiniana.AAC.1
MEKVAVTVMMTNTTTAMMTAMMTTVAVTEKATFLPAKDNGQCNVFYDVSLMYKYLVPTRGM